MRGVRTAAEKAELSDIISTTLRRDFDSIKIVDVIVSRDVDRDGDHVLVVKIIFEGVPKERDMLTMSGAVRHIRPELAKVGEEAFPLISFITKSEAKAAKLGAS